MRFQTHLYSIYDKSIIRLFYFKCVLVKCDQICRCYASEMRTYIMIQVFGIYVLLKRGGNDDEQNILSRSILKDFLSIYDISINACEKIVMTGGAGIFT